MNQIFHIKSINQVHQLFELDPPKHPLVSVLKVFDNATLKSLLNISFISDLYSISLEVGTSGSCQYGRNQFDFQEGSLVCTAPGQTIRYSETGEKMPDATQSWALLFHPDLIRKSELAKEINRYSFFHYETNEALHVSKKEKNSMQNIVENIKKECLQTIDGHTHDIIISNIKLILKYCTRYYDRQFNSRTHLNKDIVSDFEQLLYQHYKNNSSEPQGLPTVADCGKQLGISPYYLSDLLKKETGRTASDHIYFFILELAKNRLLGSGQAISEIAYDLGFSYPQHFSKLFKTKTGISPTEYRKLN